MKDIIPSTFRCSGVVAVLPYIYDKVFPIQVFPQYLCGRSRYLQLRSPAINSVPNVTQSAAGDNEAEGFKGWLFLDY